MVLTIYNTLGREKQIFQPLKKEEVSFYYCGPTVYSRQHLGNLRGAVCADIIRRSLKYWGYQVNFVSNYTDVGHLTSDADSGEDKIEKGAKREGLSPAEITQKYIKLYEHDAHLLNVLPPTIRCLATAYIPEMIAMIAKLLEKGFAYQTDSAIYFDISQANNYTQLSGQSLGDLQTGAGSGDVNDSAKKNPQDFALWFFKKGQHAQALQTWESPWGEGFPGWHIECSAMVLKNLGKTIDIHMGGIEHVAIHHTNEIAQSEAVTEEKYVNYWLHNEHLNFNGEKMSKSLGNVVYIDDILKRDFHPLALRYLFLQTHYRSKQNFTWKALQAAQKGYEHLLNAFANLGSENGQISEKFTEKFKEKLGDDFNLPQAFALISDVLKSHLSVADKRTTLVAFDQVFGLDLDKIDLIEKSIPFKNLPENIQILVQQREQARTEKNWQKSDELRDKIEKQGYLLKDISNVTQIFKKNKI